jgi:hypothetical protein
MSGIPPLGAPQEEGLFSLFVDMSSDHLRKLPSLYLGPEQVFADRHASRVTERLRIWVEAVLQATRVATYTLFACHYKNIHGLYGRDLFERSIFRRHLQRRGVTFAETPFVYLQPDGGFSCPDWGDVVPRFIVLGGEGERPDEVFRTAGAMLAFVVATYRLGVVPGPELPRLIHALSEVSAISGESPDAIIQVLDQIE